MQQRKQFGALAQYDHQGLIERPAVQAPEDLLYGTLENSLKRRVLIPVLQGNKPVQRPQPSGFPQGIDEHVTDNRIGFFFKLVKQRASVARAQRQPLNLDGSAVQVFEHSSAFVTISVK